MNYVVFTIASLVIISKFLDCYTTSVRIVSIHHERNNLARGLMSSLGVKTTIWSIFVFSILIVVLSLVVLFYVYESNFYKAVFVVLGFTITLIQLEVARTNYFGKLNKVTKLLMRFYK